VQERFEAYKHVEHLPEGEANLVLAFIHRNLSVAGEENPFQPFYKFNPRATPDDPETHEPDPLRPMFEWQTPNGRIWHIEKMFPGNQYFVTPTITSLVQAIEFYKVQNGQYPESLEELRKSLPENSMVFIFDPTDAQIGGEPRYYHYELQDESHYYLLGVGPDEKPYTSDDVLPNIEVKEDGGIGLLIHEDSKHGL